MADTTEAEQFFESVASDFDTASPLRWSFFVDGATEDQVDPIMRAAQSMGFTDVEPIADDGQEGRYSLCFAEIRVHTAESFVQRLAEVNQLAAREGLSPSDYSAGLDE